MTEKYEERMCFAMGVKFGRDYDEIVADMSEALPNIERFYEFFYMDQAEWAHLSETEQKECTKTMCDDIFFALGSRSSIPVASGWVTYEQTKHVITVNSGSTMIAIINLV